MMKDKHDPRDFEQFVKLNDDGTVAAVTMRAVGTPEPIDDASVYLNVTNLGEVDLHRVRVDPGLVQAIKDTRSTLADAALQHAQAFADHATALRTTTDAFSTAARNG